MLKKILIGSLIFGFIGILIFGAVNRVLARADTGDGIGRNRSGENCGEASSYFNKPDQSGNELGSDDLEESDCQGNGSGQGKRNVQGVAQGNGARQGNGSGNGQGNGEGNGAKQGNGSGNSQGNGQGKRNG